MAEAADNPAAPDGPRLPPQIVDQAIHWMVKLDFGDGSAAERAGFARWHAADPLHALAWERVKSLQGEFTRAPADVALATLQSAQSRRGMRGVRRRQALKALAVAGAGIGLASATREFAPWQRLLADTSTATGEQRTVRLGDGSTLVLNTDTAIRSALDGTRRLVTLLRGELLIVTGHDSGFAAGRGTPRPFWVQTPFGSLQALGTRFVVRLDAQRARVSVQQGAVALHPSAGGARRVAEAGSSWWLARAGSLPAPPPPFAADGWAEGAITGEDMRLEDLLAELARYRNGHLACDPRIAGLRVSGAFQLRDTDQALALLAQTQPVRVQYRTRFWVSVVPAGSRA